MKARLFRRSGAGVVLVVCVLAFVLLPGCHSSNKMAAMGTSEVCPSCEVATRIQPITGLTYTTCVCPSCKKVSTLEAPTRAAVEAYVGGTVGETVHVCDKCGSIVEICSVCRSK